MDEGDLIARVRRGEQRAQRELYDTHVDRVFRLAYRMAGDSDTARDFTQETFIRAFQRMDSFRGESSLATWLHSIAVSVVLNGLRSVKRFDKRRANVEEGLGVASGIREAEPDLKTRLAAAIDALPDGYRMTFLMHDVEGFTHEEIGATMGVQPGTSKAQLSRARAKLREALADVAGEWNHA